MSITWSVPLGCKVGIHLGDHRGRKGGALDRPCSWLRRSRLSHPCLPSACRRHRGSLGQFVGQRDRGMRPVHRGAAQGCLAASSEAAERTVWQSPPAMPSRRLGREFRARSIGMSLVHEEDRLRIAACGVSVEVPRPMWTKLWPVESYLVDDFPSGGDASGAAYAAPSLSSKTERVCAEALSREICQSSPAS